MSRGPTKAAPPPPGTSSASDGFGMALDDALARTAEGEIVDEAPPVPMGPSSLGMDHRPPHFAFAGEGTLVLSRSELEARGRRVAEGPAPGIDAEHDAGWTPFQPTVAERSPYPQEARDPEPSSSDDILIDTDEEMRDALEDAVTHPRLPASLDSDLRPTDPGEVAEIAAEDLVSVEALPRPHPPPPLKPAKSTPSVPPGSATSLISGAAVSGANAPLSFEATPNPAPGTPMARRQQPAGGPFGFMPSLGALAPPPMSDSAANRKRTRPWWEDLFNDDFIRTMAKVTDSDIARETNFIEESLGCEAGATILDLACGTGRHGVELAGRGYQVVGFDLSLAMLARASDEAIERNQKINFVQGDMRDMTFDETFDGVFSWNTSFGYFEDEKNAAVIAKVHRALKEGGQFLLDVINRDSVIRQAPSLAWFEGDGCICMDEMQIDFITSRMKVKRTLMMDDGRTKEIEYSIRIYSLHELGKLLHDNGFRVAEVSGGTGTPGVFFGCEAPRTLILAEKR